MCTVFLMPPCSTVSSSAPLEEIVAALSCVRGTYALSTHVVVDDWDGFDGLLLLWSFWVRLILKVRPLDDA